MYGFPGRKLNSIFAEGKLYDDGNVFIFGSSGLSCCDVFVSLVDLLSLSEVGVAVKDCGLVAVDDVAVAASDVTAADVTAADVTAADVTDAGVTVAGVTAGVTAAGVTAAGVTAAGVTAAAGVVVTAVSSPSYVPSSISRSLAVIVVING